MSLIRIVRPLPIRPTAAKLRKLMQEYGITRKSAARLMRVGPSILDRYLLPETSKFYRAIPQIRWEAFLMKVQAIYHDDEPIELPL